MLSESDAEEMSQCAINFMMRFLVTNFSTISDLTPEERSLHPIVKTEVTPIKVLFRDEKYISETIEILSQLFDEAKLYGEHQVCHCDQSCVKHILIIPTCTCN